MLRLFEFLVIIAIGVMLATNPTLEDFSGHLRQEIVQDSQHKDELSKSLAAIFGGVAGNIMTNMTVRKNYLLFSTYRTDMDDEQYHCIGVLGNFVNCGKSPRQPGQPQ